MRLDQGLGVGAARGLARSEHECVAGQFLVDAQGADAGVHERVEPAETLQEGGGCIDQRIALPQMRALVREHDGAFFFGVTLVEIGGRDDARAQPDHRAAGSGGRVID